MNLGEVLSQTWRIIWKHKILWLFGLLSSCSAGGNYGSRSGGSSPNLPTTPGAPPSTTNPLPPQVQQYLDQAQAFFQQINPSMIYLLVAVVCIIIIITVILGAIGRAGLARGVWLADEGHPKLSLGVVWDECDPYIWKVLLLQILVGLIVVLTLVVVSLVLYGLTSVTAGLAGCLVIPLICVLVPLALLLEIVVYFGTAAITGDDMGIFDALGLGWRLTFSNLANVIIMGLVLLIVTTVAGILIALPAFGALVPLFLSFANGQGLGSNLTISLVLFLAYLPVLWVLSGILAAYRGAAWTLVYRRLTDRFAKEETAPAQ